MQVTSLHLYPVKSIAPIDVHQATVTVEGFTADRRYMVVDAKTGRFVTARQDPALLSVTARWDDPQTGPELQAPGQANIALPAVSDLTTTQDVTVWKDNLTALDCGDAAAAWFSGLLNKDTRLVAMPNNARIRDKSPAMPVSFADGYPFLIASSASLDDLNQRIGENMTMRRFRPNIVVSGFPAFDEDGWIRLRIGDVPFLASSPCARCVLTTRDPITGDKHAGNEPLNSMRSFRRGQDGQLYFGVNLRPLDVGSIKVGDPVTIEEYGDSNRP